MLVLVNNMYRSFCVVFLFSFFWLIYKNDFLFSTLLLRLLIILFLFFLFIYSYKKQTEYIKIKPQNLMKKLRILKNIVTSVMIERKLFMYIKNVLDSG